jgi:hypothetical protein
MLIDNIPVSRGPDGWCVVLLGLAIEHKARAFPCGTQYSRHSGLLVELFIFIFFEGGDDRGDYRNREFIKHGGVFVYNCWIPPAMRPAPTPPFPPLVPVHWDWVVSLAPDPPPRCALRSPWCLLKPLCAVCPPPVPLASLSRSPRVSLGALDFPCLVGSYL